MVPRAARLTLSVAIVTLLSSDLLAQAELLDGFGGPEGFGTGVLEPGDDASSVAVNLSGAFPDGLNFFGTVYRDIFVNNNGNVTFNESVPFFIPDPFPVSEQPMIAPWWGDVDTRLQGAGIANDVYYHVDEPSGRLLVTWYEVGSFSLQTDELNSFQLVLTDRSDVESGDFDVEFRYNRCEWHTGDPPLSGADPLPAQAGFDAGNDRDFVTLPGSLTPQVLDLCTTSNRDEPGVWRFEIRVGDVRICGNEIVELDEDCDEGAETATCDADCTPVDCSDGHRNEAAGEACDDGNTSRSDGCSATCAIEDGWTCTRGDSAPDVCDPICGDGLILGDEACDDRNTADADGCSAECAVEPGWTCTGEPSVCVEDTGDEAGDTGPDAEAEPLELSGGGVASCAQGPATSGALALWPSWLLGVLVLAWAPRRRSRGP